MSILEFSFTDHHRRWELRPVQFKPALNLLVGLSGVGKTRILQSLEAVCHAGIGHDSALLECQWTLEVKVGETVYTWHAETGTQPAPEIVAIEGRGDDDSDDEFFQVPRQHITFSRETLTNDQGTLEVSRGDGEIAFNNNRLPKLKDSESVLSLLRQEPLIEPLFQVLSRVHKSSAHRIRHALLDQRARERARVRYQKASLQDLQEDTTLPFLLKASVLQDTHPDDFARLVVDVYRDIFPSVTDVKVGLLSDFLSERERDQQLPAYIDLIDIALREEGVDGWVTSGRMSSGMRRTLLHVLELVLSPPGTVLLIDEYENSMGINCLPAITDHILDRAGELQFIITSHHPYVINNVAKDHWMVVRREGSVVEVLPASAIPSLDTRSSQDAFVQLMNSKEYRESATD